MRQDLTLSVVHHPMESQDVAVIELEQRGVTKTNASHHLVKSLLGLDLLAQKIAPDVLFGQYVPLIVRKVNDPHEQPHLLATVRVESQ